MTSPFDWRNKPSTIGQELERDAAKSRSSARGAETALGPALHLSQKPLTIRLDPRRFHVYTRAVPSGK